MRLQAPLLARMRAAIMKAAVQAGEDLPAVEAGVALHKVAAEEDLKVINY